MRRRFLAAGLALAGVVLSVGPAASEAPEAAGWWYLARSRTLPTQAPAPASVPEGGLYVAGDPTGGTAVAAVRLTVPEGATASSLTLAVADAQGDPMVAACPPTAAWEPAEGGPWEDRPTPDCAAGAVAGELSADRSQLVFPLAPLPGAPVDLVLVPGKAAGGAVNATFSLALERPGADAIVVSEAPAPIDPPAPPSSGPAAPPAPSTSFTPADGTGPTPLLPPAPAVPAPDAAAQSTAAPAGPGGPLVSTSAAAASSGDDDRDRGRLAAVVLLAGLAVAVALLAEGGPLQLPRRGRSGDDGAVPSGVGRFARIHTGAPPAL